MLKEAGIQDKGGSCWGISKGEIEEMLGSGKPLPDAIQKVIDDRQGLSGPPRMLDYYKEASTYYYKIQGKKCSHSGHVAGNGPISCLSASRKKTRQQQ